jgi:hypothetical protein
VTWFLLSRGVTDVPVVFFVKWGKVLGLS